MICKALTVNLIELTFVSYKMAEWDDQDFLLRVWRRRDASLLRLLTARNLEMIRSKFDEEQAASKKQGLSVADFVRVMMKLVGPMAINQEELCMQILELFANIDVSHLGLQCRSPSRRRSGGNNALKSNKRCAFELNLHRSFLYLFLVCRLMLTEL